MDVVVFCIFVDGNYSQLTDTEMQCLSHVGTARHQNVYGWVDDEQSVQSPRQQSFTDGWLSMFKLG